MHARTEEAVWHLMDHAHALLDTLDQHATKRAHKGSTVSSVRLHANVDPVESATTSQENASLKKLAPLERPVIAANQNAPKANGVRAVPTPANVKTMVSVTLFLETVLAD